MADEQPMVGRQALEREEAQSTRKSMLSSAAYKERDRKEDKGKSIPFWVETKVDKQNRTFF